MSATPSSGETGRLVFSGPPARLDAWLAAARPEHSRARWQEWIRRDRVRVNGIPCKAGHWLKGGEVIEFEIPPPAPVEL
ncbi:MAG: RluA family pseudouridine synthase, partial [Verrucomicrobia bacterium]|nr:RluA family pseudouridine synthase [Verrucomicrobiota bacterium]